MGSFRDGFGLSEVIAYLMLAKSKSYDEAKKLLGPSICQYVGPVLLGFISLAWLDATATAGATATMIDVTATTTSTSTSPSATTTIAITATAANHRLGRRLLLLLDCC